MKIIYANLLGKWTPLTSEDSIFNEDPNIWIRENELHEHVFISIGHKGNGYKIHTSQIQILSKP
jgi:hypothetical protein